MKPTKIKSSEKPTHAKRLKPVVTLNKTNVRPIDTKYTCTESGRPESCPTSNSSWVPSRDWHQYLTNAKVRSARVTWHDHVGKSEVDSKDELAMKLPEVNFCSTIGETHPTKPHPSIGDLCDEDKRKIAHLVEELVRFKQEKEEDEKKILILKDKIFELKSSLKNMVGSKAVTEQKSQNDDEHDALKKQLFELNQLLYQMQVQKSTSDVQVKTISVQAEKMTRAIHVMHRENTDLQVELRVTKEKLNIAQQALDKMTKDIKDVREHIQPVMEDKACQSSEALSQGDTVHVKTLRLPDRISDDQKILTELFFNKSSQNEFNPNETIIFLPQNPNSFLQQF